MPLPFTGLHVLPVLLIYLFARLLITLREFYPHWMISVLVLWISLYLVQLGVPPVRIDILTSITGVTWEEADAGKIEGSYAGLPVFFLGRTQYIANKRTLGRKKDIADLESLGEG